MKKNLFWSLLAIFTFAAVSVGFIACGGDDDKDEGTSSIVGTWVDAHEGLKLIFTSGGTGTWIVERRSSSYSGEKTKTGAFTYTPENESRGIISLLYDSSHSSSYSSSSGNSADVFFYTIEGNKMYLYEHGYNSDDLEFTLVKQ